MLYLGYKDNELNGIWDDEFHEEFEIPSLKIRITNELRDKIVSTNSLLKFKDTSKLETSKIYDIENFDSLLEEHEVKINMPSTQDKLNAQFLKEEAELKKEVQEQKTLNAQVLKEIAKLKGGAV